MNATKPNKQNLLGIVCFTTAMALPLNLSAATLRGDAFAERLSLGDGVESMIMLAKPRPCVSGKPVFINASAAHLTQIYNSNFENTLDTKNGTGHAAGSVGWGAFSVKSTIDYLGHTASTDLSLSSTIAIEVSSGTFMLTEPRLTDEGRRALVLNDPVKIREVCGDQLVSQITLGGRFFISVTYLFDRKETKSSFTSTTKASAAWGLASKTTTKTDNYSAFSKKVKLRINALQLGGDPSQLQAITSLHPSPTCDIADMAPCLDLLQSLMRYAKTSFGLQLASGGSASPQIADNAFVVSYVTNSYEDTGSLDLTPAGTLPDSFVPLSAAITSLKSSIIANAEADKRVGDALDGLSLPNDERQRLTQIQSNIQKNQLFLDDALDKCKSRYLDIPLCIAKVKQLPIVLTPIPANQLEIGGSP